MDPKYDPNCKAIPVYKKSKSTRLEVSPSVCNKRLTSREEIKSMISLKKSNIQDQFTSPYTTSIFSQRKQEQRIEKSTSKAMIQGAPSRLSNYSSMRKNTQSAQGVRPKTTMTNRSNTQCSRRDIQPILDSQTVSQIMAPVDNAYATNPQSHLMGI